MTNFYIRYKHGMGNRILFLVLIVYIYTKTKKRVYIINDGKKVDHKDTEKVLDFFPNIKDIIEFKDWMKEGFYHLYKIKPGSQDILDIFNIKHNEILLCEGNFALCFYAAFHIYDQIDKSTRDKYFQFNYGMITKEVQKMADIKYNTIHIRYGDKLEIVHDIIWNHRRLFSYSLPTPQFYIDNINKLLDSTDLDVYILTDSYKLVEQYVYKRFKSNRRVKLLDYGLFDSFYILYLANTITGSVSTFSASAILLSENNVGNWFYNPREIDKHKNDSNKRLDETRMIKGIKGIRNVEFIVDDKYFLNKNKKLVKTMYLDLMKSKTGGVRGKARSQSRLRLRSKPKSKARSRLKSRSRPKPKSKARLRSRSRSRSKPKISRK